jgi:hypothetical protein
MSEKPRWFTLLSPWDLFQGYDTADDPRRREYVV